MGSGASSSAARSNSAYIVRESSGIKIHATVSRKYSIDGNKAIVKPLGEASDEELLAEIARRNIDIRTKITDAVVKETYDYGAILGKGASGVVQEVTHKHSKRKYALKIIQKNDEINDMESMLMEIEIMKRVRHRYVISMYELFETSHCLWVVMELYSGGSMHDYLMRVEGYHEGLAALHVSQMLQGLHYMHSLGIIHRDLKLENILMHDAGDGIMEVKIADFGLSCLLPLGLHGYDINQSAKRKKYDRCEEMWGTREFFAPELIDSAYGPQADLWSLGCIVYEMLVGHATFSLKACRNNELTLYEKIQTADFDVSSDEWHRVSDSGQKFIRDLLTVKPTKRLCCEEALEHVWIKTHTQLDPITGEYLSTHKLGNSKRYKEYFAEERKVRRKGAKFGKPLKAALTALSSVRNFQKQGSSEIINTKSASSSGPDLQRLAEETNE